MAALNERQQAFVLALFDINTRDATHAAEQAGYSTESRGSLKVQAHRLWHDARIQEAIDEVGKRQFKGMVPFAIKTLALVRDNPQASGAERTKAAQLILDRGGFHGVTEHKMVVEHIADDPDQMKRIAAMAAMLGLPVEKLLGRRLALQAPVIDMEPANPFADEEY